jgi:hypothetical protein
MRFAQGHPVSVREWVYVNKNGTKENLVACHLGNTNAVKSGAHSERFIQSRAEEIKEELASKYELSPDQMLTAHEVARNMAILEAIDRDLDERGLVGKNGKPSYLLDTRMRVSRQLDHWLAKLTPTIERQTSAGEMPRAGWSDYVRELQRIALGHDPTARTADRLSALKELMALGQKGTSSFLEPVESETSRRWSDLIKAQDEELLEGLEAIQRLSKLGPSDARSDQ